MTLNHRITVQSPSAAQDELGQPVAAWVDLAALWADVRHTSGLQAIKAGAQLSTVAASIRVRKRADLAAGQRVLHGSTVYAVRAVLLVGRDMMDLVCEVQT